MYLGYYDSSERTLMSFFSSILLWFSSLFFSKSAEISVVGLQASGKTSFVNVIGSGQWTEDVVPTIAFNYRKVRKGAVTFKIWDVAGQPKFRSMWERYCNGVDAVIFVVDSADQATFHTARFELHQLLSHPSLAGVPLLVLGNKNDIPGHATVKDLIRELQDPEPSCFLLFLFDAEPTQFGHRTPLADRTGIWGSETNDFARFWSGDSDFRGFSVNRFQERMAITREQNKQIARLML